MKPHLVIIQCCSVLTCIPSRLLQTLTIVLYCHPFYEVESAHCFENEYLAMYSIFKTDILFFFAYTMHHMDFWYKRKHTLYTALLLTESWTWLYVWLVMSLQVCNKVHVIYFNLNGGISIIYEVWSNELQYLSDLGHLPGLVADKIRM